MRRPDSRCPTRIIGYTKHAGTFRDAIGESIVDADYACDIGDLVPGSEQDSHAMRFARRRSGTLFDVMRQRPSPYPPLPIPHKAVRHHPAMVRVCPGTSSLPIPEAAQTAQARPAV